MMKRMSGWTAAGLALIALVAVLSSACGDGDTTEGSEPTNPVQVIVNTPDAPVTVRPRRTPTPSPVATATPLVVCAPNPDPASPKVLQVQEPLPNQDVRLPVHVRGWGSTIGENNRGVAVSVVDQKQSVVQVSNLPPLPREFRAAPAGMDLTDNTRPFAIDIVLNNLKEPTPYCLWVYLGTSGSGRAQQVVQIPVVIHPLATN